MTSEDVGDGVMVPLANSNVNPDVVWGAKFSTAAFESITVKINEKTKEIIIDKPEEYTVTEEANQERKTQKCRKK